MARRRQRKESSPGVGESLTELAELALIGAFGYFVFKAFGPSAAQASSGPALAAPPGIADALRAWQAARLANGENPNDWQAFRNHSIAIGAGDPGGVPMWV